MTDEARKAPSASVPGGEPGAPLIERVNGTIATLERRIDGLTQRIDDGRGSDGALNFDRAERGALKRAILALKWWQADHEGLDTPILALAELLDAVEIDRLENGYDDGDTAVESALDRARGILAEWKPGDG